MQTTKKETHERSETQFETALLIRKICRSVPISDDAEDVRLIQAATSGDASGSRPVSPTWSDVPSGILNEVRHNRPMLDETIRIADEDLKITAATRKAAVSMADRVFGFFDYISPNAYLAWTRCRR